MTDRDQVTNLLSAWQGGDESALEQLSPYIYRELHRLAARAMDGEAAGHTLQPTALVHEAWLRLVGNENPNFHNQAHFFAAAAEAMRRIIIDRARRAARVKHGGDRVRITLSAVGGGAEPEPEELLAVNEALESLERQDPRMAEVVKLRTFAGLTQDETAAVMGVSRRTVNRLSTAARAWLAGELVQR